MEYYAHSREDKQFQLLRTHLEEVAQLSSDFAEVFGPGYLGYLAGILHDLGKYSEKFQQRIRGSKIRVPHSTAGAKWITDDKVVSAYLGTSPLDRPFANLLANVIAGHHGGLLNHGTIDDEGTLRNRLEQVKGEDYATAWKEIEVVRQPWDAQKNALASKWNRAHPAWSYSFFGRMLYSCLVDADSINTRDYCNGTESVPAESMRPSMHELQTRFNEYMTEKQKDSEDTPINQMRRHILAACERQAELTPRLFSLTVPTGGGKTLSSMAFALRHAIANDKRRIIYVIPFTSIIEQNAEQFRAALGHEAILEHHSNFNEEMYEENYGRDEVRRLKLSAENWDAPVVVTTSVQFFESLFSNQRSKCRKIHNIADSIIIVDEAQGIPRGYMMPCLRALDELVRAYGCSVVLCTATQPVWTGLGMQVTEMMDRPTPAELFTAFQRVEVDVQGCNTLITEDSQLVQWMEDAEQVLCIVNTRTHAQKLFAQLAARNVEGVFHLSGRMCAKHRSAILQMIRERLKTQAPCRVVSTQLIEAGVDVDFPHVLRAYAGLDSIAQAAGRCNREGRREAGRVVVFYPEKHGMPAKGWLKEAATEAQHTIMADMDDAESPLSLPRINHYFERIHGIGSCNMEQLTDAKGIMNLLKLKNTNFEIPYQEIANKFTLIDGDMQAVVVPYDRHAADSIHALSSSLYPLREMRRLQPYTVQLYRHEFMEFQRNNLLRNVEGVWVLLDMAFYHLDTGLIAASDSPEIDVLIF